MSEHPTKAAVHIPKTAMCQEDAALARQPPTEKCLSSSICGLRLPARKRTAGEWQIRSTPALACRRWVPVAWLALERAAAT